MKKYNRFFRYCLLSIVAILCATSFSLFPANAESSYLPNCFDIVASPREGKSFTVQVETTYSGSDATQYSYDEIEKVSFSVNQSAIVEDPDDKYTYSIGVKYAQMVIEDTSFENNTIVKSVTDIYTGKLSDLTADTKFDFFFDPAVEGEDKKQHGIGWGIYQFNFTAKSEDESEPVYTGNSKYIVLRAAYNFPSSQPEIKVSTPSSRWGMQDAYLFEITDEFYKYCDQRLIVWYMTGQAIDGTRYALTETDLSEDRFKTTCDKGMYQASDAIERHGRTFLFDSKTSGEWRVWCEINGEIVSQTFEVTTVSELNSMILIIVLVAVAVLLLGVIVFIIIYTKKREKVW